MPRKRKNRRRSGDGSVYQASDGRWFASVSVRGADGKRKRIVRTASSHEDAERLRRQLAAQVQRKPASTSTLMLGEYLERWLLTIKSSKEPATYDSYSRAVRNHILPHIGVMRIMDLSPIHIEDWIAVHRGLGTGDRTLQNAYAVLHTACKRAVMMQLIDSNPCKVVERPKHTREPILPFTLAEVQLLLKTVAESPWRGVYELALHLGLRQGEIFGLQWKDIDWTAETIRIERQASEVCGRVTLKTPKTPHSTRTLRVSQSMLDTLKDRQAYNLKRGYAAKPGIFLASRGGLVIRSGFGARQWRPLLKDLGIRHRGFHHCRHTAATIMLQNRIPLHVVSGILGHASPSITSDIYSHFIPGAGDDVPAQMERIFGASG